jgi:fluoride exporter
VTPGLLVALMAAGALGALARAWLTLWVQARWSRPGTGTLIVNLLGAFALGLWLGAAGSGADGATSAATTLVGTGFLGAFTTFSTWMVELHARAARGEGAAAALEAALTLAAGTGLAVLGAALTLR